LNESQPPELVASRTAGLKRVAVVAGTPYDTQLGCSMLRARGIPCEGFPLAANPDEQSALQYFSVASLQATLHRVATGLAPDQYGTMLLFCNSLSTAIDHALLERTSPFPIVSPLLIYRRLPHAYSRLLLLTANGQTLASIEKCFLQESAHMTIVGISNIALVRAIESGRPVADIYRAFHLTAFAQLASALSLQAIVLACTHFTPLLPRLQAEASLPIIDIGAILIEYMITGILTVPTIQ
jgi:glutamate racemase